MKYIVRSVQSRRELKTFIRWPQLLFRNNALWVPPLERDEWNTLYPHWAGQTPVKTLFLLAFLGKRIVGRIVGIAIPGDVDNDKRPRVRWGWLDAIDDPDVFSVLLETMERWAKSLQAETIQGPLGFSNLDKAGMLVEGFEELPTIVELYNPDYYPRYVEACGYSKTADWVEYEFSVPDRVPDKLIHLAHVIRSRFQVKTLEIRRAGDLRPYGQELFRLINETHRHLHGFVPFDEEKAVLYLDKYFPLLNKDLISIVQDKEGVMIGYGISIPSMSRAFQRAHGRLYPFGLRHILHASRKNDRADLYLIGVKDAYRNTGIIALMFEQIMQGFIHHGIKKVESNPELETNSQVQALWKNYQYRQHKRRRCFEKIVY